MGSPQQQAMLVTLLLRRGRTATAADLLEALWGNEAPAAALTTIRTYAWRLRRALEVDRKAPRFLLSLGDGYRLVLEDDDVDADRAGELGKRAEGLREAGDLTSAHALLVRALALWRGEPLAGIPGPFAHRQRERLGELRLTLLEERIDVGLQLGIGHRDIPELSALIQDHVLRERPYGLLMRAQLQAGRQAEALSTYRDLRRLLIEELGVEPSSELESLQQRILNGDRGLDKSTGNRAAERPVELLGPGLTERSVTAEDAAPSSSPPPVPAQLPPVPADFTGRSHIAATLVAALNPAVRTALPVVVVAGMGGVGKSALALQVAHQVRGAYPDGQLYAELHGSETTGAHPDDVLAYFLSALGTSPSALPDSLDAKAGLFRSLVDRRRILIVLDDAKDADQVRLLLPGTADCGVLLTSRSRLVGLPAVQTDLDVFHPSEALELLARSVGILRMEAEPDKALELVRLCGFLPLAVRIVAARLAARPRWSIGVLAKRLADERGRIDELRAGELTVAAAFEVGYRQLTSDQADALRMIACVDGPGTSLPSAAVMLDTDEASAEGLLESLVDAAMLESPSVGRYRYHDLLRAFARQKAGSEQREALFRLLDFLLATAINAFRHAVPGDPILDTIGPAESTGMTFANAREARTWARAEGEGALALALQIARFAKAEALAGHEDVSVRGLRAAIDLLIALSPFRLDALASEFDVIDELIQASVTCGDLRSQSRAHFLRGNIALAAARLSDAEPEATVAVEQCRITNDPGILRQALNDLGLIRQLRGDFEGAVTHYGEAIVLAQRLEHRSGEVVTTVNSALAHVYWDKAEKAAIICRKILEDWGDLQDHDALSYTHYVLGLAAHELAQYSEALASYEACLALCLEAGLLTRERQARYRSADTLRALGEPGRAVTEAELALQLCQSDGDAQDKAYVLMALGQAESDLGHVRRAEVCLRQAHALLSQLGLPGSERAARLLAALRENTVELAGP